MPPSDKTTWIAHVDLDAFFASCEQRDNPEFRGKPVVVGARPGKRGVVAAASYEARVFGIRSAMPINEAYRRCPDAVFLRPDMPKYTEASRTVFACLDAITPTIEKASIDEAYLDISGLEKLLGNPNQIGHAIKRLIIEASGLTASVGIGPNRLIAKLGSDFSKPDGLTVVAEHHMAAFLAPLPVANLRGAGQQTQKIFQHMGIKTIGELKNMSLQRLAEQLGQRAAENFKRQAEGQASAKVLTNRSRKSISKERTFQTDKSPDNSLRKDLLSLAQEVAATARHNKLAGRVIRLKIRYRGFQTYTRQIKMAHPTDDERVICEQAWSLLIAGDLPAKPVRLIGVGLSDWQSAQAEQPDLFAESNPPSDKRLLTAIDDVRSRFGTTTIQLGGLPKPK